MLCISSPADVSSIVFTSKEQTLQLFISLDLLCMDLLTVESMRRGKRNQGVGSMQKDTTPVATLLYQLSRPPVRVWHVNSNYTKTTINAFELVEHS